MVKRTVNVFFYGYYINFNALKEVDINEREFEVGIISGWELTISPLANLVKNKHVVFLDCPLSTFRRDVNKLLTFLFFYAIK